MSNNGWISLNRSILKHDIVGLNRSRKYSRFEAWIWLLLRANYEDARCCIGNQVYHLKRGQMIVSQKKMRLLFKWSNSKLTGFLKMLEKDGMVEYETTNKMSIITLLKYNDYQNIQHQKNIKSTSNQYQKHTINKNINKNSNKEIKYFIDFWNLYDKKVGKEKTEKYWIKNIKAKDIKPIMDHVEKYVKIRTKQYRKNPHSYLLNRVWEDELIETTEDFVDEYVKEKEKVVDRRYKEQMEKMKKEQEEAPDDSDWTEIQNMLKQTWNKNG